MLKRFPTGLPCHLELGGEGRLILSDLNERLGLRGRAEFDDRWREQLNGNVARKLSRLGGIGGRVGEVRYGL
ncbi:hypothetical protein [Streptomyces sp. NPDC059593]|uniref:hypothetical protein n=1 Tax=Streptomyces sp. NPDC059593 TaxID=3346878 RepID=UPI00367E9833